MNEIVVGVDQSATSRRAAEAAARIACESGSTLHLVSCVDRSSANVRAGGEHFHVDSVQAAEQYIAGLHLDLAPPDITHAISFDDPAKALCSEAERLGARMIVVGNRRVQGASRVLGSVAVGVVRHAPCGVLVANTTDD